MASTETVQRDLPVPFPISSGRHYVVDAAQEFAHANDWFGGDGVGPGGQQEKISED
jgi:hypothetical protein